MTHLVTEQTRRSSIMDTKKSNSQSKSMSKNFEKQEAS